MSNDKLFLVRKKRAEIKPSKILRIPQICFHTITFCQDCSRCSESLVVLCFRDSMWRGINWMFGRSTYKPNGRDRSFLKKTKKKLPPSMSDIFLQQLILGSFPIPFAQIRKVNCKRQNNKRPQKELCMPEIHTGNQCTWNNSITSFPATSKANNSQVMAR